MTDTRKATDAETLRKIARLILDNDEGRHHFKAEAESLLALADELPALRSENEELKRKYNDLYDKHDELEIRFSAGLPPSLRSREKS